MTISIIAHAVALVCGLISFAFKSNELASAEPLPVDIISFTDFTQLTAGAKTAPKAPTPKPLVEKVAEQQKPADDTTAKISEKPEVVTAAAPMPKPAPEVKPEPKPPEPKPEPKPAPRAEPKPVEPPKKQPDPKPDPIAEALKKEDAKKKEEAKKPEPKKEEAKAPPPPKKPEPPKPEVAEKKPPQPRFDANRIAALLDKRDPTRHAATGSDVSPTPSLGVATGNAAQLTASEIEALRSRLAQCWNPPAGVAEAKGLVVQVRILFNRDGSLAADPSVLNRGGHPAFNIAAESALRAVRSCAPYSFMPVAKYERWKDVEVNFDPRDLFRG